MELLSKKLKLGNLKVTPQRLAIYKFLCETTSHPTAETIYSNLKETHPTMSIATVYKNLITLKNANLINELNINDSSFHYDANTDFHSHLICNCCHSVLDYDFQLTSKFETTVTEETGFLIESTQLYFYGKCNNCKNKN